MARTGPEENRPAEGRPLDLSGVREMRASYQLVAYVGAKAKSRSAVGTLVRLPPGV